MDKFLTRQQVKVIIDQAPKNTNGGKLIQGLVDRGYKLEGYNDQPVASEKPNYLQRVGSDIKQGIQGAKADINSNDNRSALSKGISAVSDVASAVISPVTEAPVVKQIGEVIGKGIEKGGELLSRVYSPEFQQSLHQLPEEDYKKATQLLTDTSNTANIANAILLVEGVNKGVKKTVDVAKTTANNVSNAFSNVTANASKYPKQIFDKITEGKIDPKTKTILADTNVEKFDRYVKSGQEAINNPRSLTPLEQAGETANNILPKMKEDLSNIGRQKQASLESVGDTKVKEVTTPEIESMQKFLQTKLTDSERSFVNSYIEELKSLGKNPSAKSVDATIDKLQQTFFERKGGTSIPVTSRVKSLVNTSIRNLNENLKRTVDSKLGSSDYSNLNAEYQKRVNIFQELNQKLGEDGNKGGSLLKRFFSPQDSGTKKLFANIKEVYGVDLAQDATLAKFVMDTLGDVRAKSLLELPPTSPTGVIQRGLKYLEDKATSPQKVLDKARSKIKP